MRISLERKIVLGFGASAVILLAVGAARLQVLTADNAAQQRRLDSLTTLVHERLSALARVVELRRTGGAAAAAHEVATGLGHRLRGPIRSTVGQMADAE